MPSTSDAFVWVWLPNQHEPVVAGRLQRAASGTYRFGYGRSYLERADAISLYGPELPLRPGWIEPLPNLVMASCLRDGAPDAWGRRVIDYRHGLHAASATELTELTYLLESGSNRIGGLDFQANFDVYVPRESSATLDELHAAAGKMQAGESLSATLADALLHGSSIGGARPKALLTQDHSQYIAKFTSTADHFPVINAEAVAMNLASRVGIDVAPTHIVRSLGADVLIVQRFDRTTTGGRRLVVSGLTMLGLDEMAGRYGTYPDLVDVLNKHGSDPHAGRKVFARIVFNVAVGNTDDHARNHAAFWDGHQLTLTPAYDISPQPRTGWDANQAMSINREPLGLRGSTFANCVAAAPLYGLTKSEARTIIDHQIEIIRSDWTAATDAARLTETDRNRLWGTQILHPRTMDGYN